MNVASFRISFAAGYIYFFSNFDGFFLIFLNFLFSYSNIFCLLNYFFPSFFPLLVTDIYIFLTNVDR